MGVVVYLIRFYKPGSKNRPVKDYVSRLALRPARLLMFLNMYQNVNDLLLLNLVKGVTSPERVVRAAGLGCCCCCCGLVL